METEYHSMSKRSSIFFYNYVLPRAYKTRTLWGGVQGRCTLIPNFRNDGYHFGKIVILVVLFSVIYAFRGGGEEVCKKSAFCTLVKMIKKWTTTLI